MADDGVTIPLDALFEWLHKECPTIAMKLFLDNNAKRVEVRIGSTPAKIVEVLAMPQKLIVYVAPITD